MIWPSAQQLLAEAREAVPTLPASRDFGLLAAAIASARNLELYGARDPFDIAAHLLVGVVRHHPLIDGNKRLAWIAGCLLLELNSLPLQELRTTGQSLAVELLKRVAARQAGVVEVACFLAGATSAKAGS